MPRRLISDDGVTRVYEHTNDAGIVTGSATEMVNPPPVVPSPEEQLASLTEAVDQLILDSLGGL